MLPIPPINAHPKTDIKDSCNCCNPIKVMISRSRTNVSKDHSGDELQQVASKVKEQGSTIISTSGRMYERKRSAPQDVRELW